MDDHLPHAVERALSQISELDALVSARLAALEEQFDRERAISRGLLGVEAWLQVGEPPLGPRSARQVQAAAAAAAAAAAGLCHSEDDSIFRGAAT